jgi:hypothetical protein
MLRVNRPFPHGDLYLLFLLPQAQLAQCRHGAAAAGRCQIQRLRRVRRRISRFQIYVQQCAVTACGSQELAHLAGIQNNRFHVNSLPLPNSSVTVIISQLSSRDNDGFKEKNVKNGRTFLVRHRMLWVIQILNTKKPETGLRFFVFSSFLFVTMYG